MRHFLIISFLIGLVTISCQQNLQPGLQSYQNIGLDSTIAADPAFKAYIAPLHDSIESIMNEVIGTSKKQLFPEKPETPLSHFVADLIREEALREINDARYEPLPTIAVINIKGLRTPLPKGDITVRDIYSLMPFENQMVILKLSGEVVYETFMQMGASGGDGLSGASFIFKDQKVINPMIQGEPLKTDKYYYVVTPDYLANGGDHYTFFSKAEKRYTSQKKIRDIILNHIRTLTKKGKIIDPPEETRIQIQVK